MTTYVKIEHRSERALDSDGGSDGGFDDHESDGGSDKEVDNDAQLPAPHAAATRSKEGAPQGQLARRAAAERALGRGRELAKLVAVVGRRLQRRAPTCRHHKRSSDCVALAQRYLEPIAFHHTSTCLK